MSQVHLIQCYKKTKTYHHHLPITPLYSSITSYIIIKLIRNQAMNQAKSKRIQFYSPSLIGHAYPLAKMAEIIQKRCPQYQVTFITFEIAKAKLEKEFPKLNFIGIQPDFTAEKEKELIRQPPHLCFPVLFSLFREYFIGKKEVPQLIISDFFAVEAANFARLNNIKLLVDFPNSFNIKNLINFFSDDRTHLIEGILVHQPMPIVPMLAVFDPLLDSFRNWGRLMFHTFVGLDNACVKPSNYEFIGLMPNRTSQQLTPELKEWMDSWKAKGKEKFLYVSFGSVLTISSNFTKKLANIFSELGYPIIWSLRTPQNLSLKDSLIFHRQWLPQQAILRLPQVRGYMTHCGWGSITEAITSKTPLICVPVFGDQPGNARMVVSKHIGVQIYDTMNLGVPQELDLQINDDDIIAGVSKVMNDDSYLQSIVRLNGLSSLHSAEENIVRIVKETMEYGNEHLICKKFQEATFKTGQPLSKILVKEYLPKERPAH